MSDGPTPGTVVVGVGNPLLGDEGLGISALSTLQEAWDFDDSVQLVDGGTSGMNLLPLIEAARRVIFIDAIDAGQAPGTLIILEHDELPLYYSEKLSAHQIGLQEVLAAARLRDSLPLDTVAIGLQPESVDWGLELSAVLSDRMNTLIHLVIQRLREWGHTPREKIHA